MPQLPKITEALLDQMMAAAFEPLAEAFPDLPGDIPPDVYFPLRDALRSAAQTWVAGNMPADRPLPFEHFQATGRAVDDLSVCDIGVDEPGPGRIYDDSLRIEERPPQGWPNGRPERWFLILGREDWLSDDLEELERHLYAYYLSECA